MVAPKRLTNGQLFTELEGVRKELKDTREVLKHKAGRKSIIALALPIVVSLIVAIGGLLYYLDTNHRICVDGNERRELVRMTIHDSMIESGEAIIAISGQSGEPPNPEIIQAYRDEINRRSDEIVNQIKDVKC